MIDRKCGVLSSFLLMGLLLSGCTGYRPFEDLCYRQCGGPNQAYETLEDCRAKCRDNRPDQG